MPNQLVIRDQITEALSHSLDGGKHGLRNVPGLLRRAINEEAWRERIVRQTKERIAGFPSLRAYVEAHPPEGLGTTCELVERLIKDDAKTLTMFRAATVGKKGAHHNNVMTSESRQGNSRAYVLDRLKRERPDLFNKVAAEKMSANAAAIAAGFKKKLSPYEQILKLLPKLTASERRALRAELEHREAA